MLGTRLRSKMSLKFCANLNFMFTESSDFLDRYRLAKQAGFTGVEGVFPPDHVSITDLTGVCKETGLEQILMNIATGDVPGGQFGCAAFPEHVDSFRTNLERTIEYAKAVNCKKIHVMAGKLAGPATAQHDTTYLKNLRTAASLLEKNNILGVIEPINKYSVPGYYLACYEKAIRILKEVNSPNLKLMFDIFHAQHIRGDISSAIKTFAPYIGHVQLAQVPNRNEPDTEGELNYRYVLQMLESSGYTDWVGCEYKPKTATVEGLGWLRDFGYWSQ
ncbi:putative hydroxypyruvate isomerase [Topomyia yanbarensis]|uniref:putative hydroxypyruvate isomerase n=1 Tax=Topomyia yanbarensis TaxID=2498891 RepID=UPI00273B7BAF|nr:putative hydroxypyruvate isomerase [Topomyia yanbarensis]XP_058813317.1 putative hydroxypyruvate isomerase [Topomyia yanbarensis]XP_058813318.1 putative hydroxypyruvate isomerase [Topomyia yanbarensis]